MKRESVAWSTTPELWEGEKWRAGHSDVTHAVLPIAQLDGLPRQSCPSHPEGCALHISHLAATMKSGAAMPPIVVEMGPDKKHFRVLDGSHRIVAAKALRHTHVPAAIVHNHLYPVDRSEQLMKGERDRRVASVAAVSLTDQDRLDILGRALDAGLSTHGGDCGAMALAINHHLFGGQGKLVAAVNDHLWKRGHFVGHVGVQDAHGSIWDGEGTFDGKSGREQFRAWGSVDHRDSDYHPITENQAHSARIRLVTEQQIRQMLPSDNSHHHEILGSLTASHLKAKVASKKLGKSQRKKEPRKVASIAVFDDRGRLLFGRRQDTLLWSLPGGRFEEGEGPFRAAVRECVEETNLRPKTLEILGSEVVEAREGGEVEVFAFRAQASGEPTGVNDPDGEFGDDFRWVDVSEGLPAEIAENLHAPRNVVLKLLSLQDWDKTLAKAHPFSSDPKHQLVAVHNTSEAGIHGAHELGGLPGPSLAIAHKHYPFHSFGDISLVAPKHLVDPKTTPVFDADVYSPRLTRPRVEINAKAKKPFEEMISPHAQALRTHISSYYEEMERHGHRDVVQNYSTRGPLALAYLQEKGTPLTPVTRQTPLHFPWTAMPAMREFVATHGMDVNFGYDSPYHHALSAVAKTAIGQYINTLDPDVREMIGEAHLNQDFDDEGRFAFGSGWKVLRDLEGIGKTEVDSHATHEMALKAIKGREADFEDWAVKKLQPLMGKKYFPKHIDTADGPRLRKVPYTLENAVKMMGRSIRQGENFNYGLGTARAGGARQFRSVEEMRAAAESGKIVSGEEMKAAKEAMDDRFGKLADEVSPYHPNHGGFGILDALAMSIGDSYKRGSYLHRALKENGFEGVPSDVHGRVAQFARDLLQQPTEYFEAKLMRPVHFHEFAGAAVPHDVSPEVLDILAQRGVKEIVKYKRDDPAARWAAVKKIARGQSLMMSEDDKGWPTLQKTPPTDLAALNPLEILQREWAKPVLDDEIARLLRHPNPAERSMALKLEGVTPAHLKLALEQSYASSGTRDGDEAIFAHPAVNREVLAHALDLWPGFHDAAWKNPLFDADHVHQAVTQGLERNSALGPGPNDVAHNIATRALEHPALRADTISALVRHPHMPLSVVRDLLMHPNAPPGETDGVVRRALGLGVEDYSEVPTQRPSYGWEEDIKEILGNNPHLSPALIDQIIGLGNKLPLSHAKDWARAAFKNPAIDPKHIDDLITNYGTRGLQDERYMGEAMENPALTPQHIHRMLDLSRAGKARLWHMLSHPNATGEHLDRAIANGGPHIQTILNSPHLEDRHYDAIMDSPWNTLYWEAFARHERLPPRIIDRLISHRESSVRMELAVAQGPGSMLKDSSGKVVRPPRLSIEQQGRLLQDPEPFVASKILDIHKDRGTYRLPRELLDAALKSPHYPVRTGALASTPMTDEEMKGYLSHSETHSDARALEALRALSSRRELSPAMAQHLATQAFWRWGKVTDDGTTIRLHPDAHQAARNIAAHPSTPPEALREMAEYDPQKAPEYAAMIGVLRAGALGNPNTPAEARHHLAATLDPEDANFRGLAAAKDLTPEMARILWSRVQRPGDFRGVTTELVANSRTPVDVLESAAQMARSLKPPLVPRTDAENLAEVGVSSALINNPLLPLSTLRMLAAEHPQEQLRDLATDRLSIHDPDSVYKTQVRVRPGLGRLRKIRDHILERAKKTREMSPKDLEAAGLPKGDFLAPGRLPNGNISADKLQAHIDSQPSMAWNLSHSSWDDAQRHSEDPSKVLQVNLTTAHVDAMKAAGVWETFQKMAEASFSASHPVTKHSMGWVRYTGSNKADRKPKTVRDEGQLDNLPVGAVIEHTLDGTVRQYRKKASGDWFALIHPQAEGLTTSPNSLHYLAKKAPFTVKSASVAEGAPGYFVDEVQSDFGQSFVKKAAGEAREHAEREARERGLTPEQTQAHVADFVGRARSEAQAKWGPEDHYQKISQILFHGRHPNEILSEAFMEHLRAKGQHRATVNWHTPESKGPISNMDMSRPVPGHMKVTYKDVPEKLGAEKTTYGSLTTEHGSQPSLKGPDAKPIWTIKVRKFEDDLGLWMKALAKSEGPKAPARRAAHTAASFLSGLTADPRALRRAAWLHDQDHVAAALVAHDLPVTEEMRQSVAAVSRLQAQNPHPQPTPDVSHPKEIVAARPEGQEAAEAVKRSFAAGEARPVTLGGKHSAGTVLCHDPKTKATWLLKPGSGDQSPAAGAREEGSSQSAREAAFFQVARAWGLGEDLPRAELLIVDGRQVAAIAWLPPEDWEQLEDAREDDTGAPARILEPYRVSGRLHQWGILDLVLGQTDRHFGNLMVTKDSDDPRARLIDHGAAFAGPDFDPAHDRASFIPCYLRLSVPTSVNFNAQSQEEKLRGMAQTTEDGRQALRTWVAAIDGEQLRQILAAYGINPQASLDRLARIKALAGPLDAAVNGLWVTI